MTKVTQLSLDEEGGLGRRRIHLREISGDSETPLETVGQDLRAARMRRGEDLATVSRALKIRKDHLNAVEEDDLENLPGKTYAIGFVRAYAGYLGLDAAQMVDRFKAEISGRHDEHAAPGGMIDDDEGRRLPQGWRIVAGVVGLALAYGAWHLISAGPTQETVPAPPSETLARPAPKPQAPPPVQAETESVPAPAKTTAAAPPVSAPVAPPPAAAPPPAPKAATNIDASPPGTAARVTGGTATPSPAVPAVPGSAAIAPSTGRVYGAGNRTARIILRAKGDTHIEVRDSDGTVFINRNLKEGDVYRVPNVPGLSLSTTNAGAVAVEMDGQIMGRAGAENETAGDINLDPQAIADRANR